MSSSRLDLTNLPLVSIPTSPSGTGVNSTSDVTSTTSSTGVGGVSSPRLNLFTTSGYDGATTVSLDNGQTLSLPTLSNEEQAQVNALFGNLTSTQQLQLSDASRKLAQALYAQVGYNPQAAATQSTTSAAVTTSAVSGVGTAVSGSVGAASTSSSSTTDVSSLVQAAFKKALQDSSSAPNAAQNDSDNMDDDDSDDDDDNSWAGGLQSAVPQQQQLSLQSSSALTANSALTSAAQSTSSAVQSSSAAASANSAVQNANAANKSVATTSSTVLSANAATTASSAVQAATKSVATTSSALGSGAAPTSASVSVATPAVVSNINSAGNAYNKATGNQDFDKTVQAVSYMGMLGLQGDMENMANQVQTNVDQQNQTRTDLADVRQAVANWPSGTDTEHFTWTSYDQSGNPVQNSQDLNLSQAQALQSNLEDQLTSQSDMNQEQQLKLQDVTQKYQEAVNTISNLLKYEHDTVKAIIQNIHT